MECAICCEHFDKPEGGPYCMGQTCGGSSCRLCGEPLGGDQTDLWLQREAWMTGGDCEADPLDIHEWCLYQALQMAENHYGRHESAREKLRAAYLEELQREDEYLAQLWPQRPAPDKDTQMNLLP